jgi:hypothetical protein
MKKELLVIILSLFAFSACGDDSREEKIEEVIPAVAQDSLTVIEAEFIHLADAAVLKGRSFIYGVELDSIAMKLAKEIEPLKNDEFEMIPVKVRAKIIKNPGQNGWDELVQIREILEIPEKQSDSVKSPAANNK